MDGSGRWAEKRSLPRSFGHKRGVKTVKKIVKAASNLGIRVLTLYAFSAENWKRPQSEIKELFSLISQFIKKELEGLNNCGIKLRILGDLSRFSESIRTEVENASKITSQNTGLELNIALNYGARQELIHAFEEMSKQNIKKPTEEIISSFLYTAGQPDPDLLIRTSGEFRVSNFLLWQIAYCEIYITDKLWPDFTQQDLKTALSEFQKRERRFGGL
ncbi:UDP pyrophosphate synthase [Candidatus Endomicrobiellum trichonymphae]|uniref:Isoprenyl transferase n=1 Tax=Endomicrobium trichonymphae TaxID=1408204 RepID=A0A1E5II67_ENDTX|nr:UDP pyrophosphate synthase [Candidatus Endomicrobium trichonymphae]